MKLLKLITLALIIFAIPACSDNEPTEEKKQSAYADWVNAMRNHDNEKAKQPRLSSSESKTRQRQPSFHSYFPL